MTVSSGFFDSVNHDRLYNADQVSSMFDGLILDGVYENMGDAFAIDAYPDAENTVIVGTGRAWFDHTWTLNDTQYALTLDPPSDSMSRIDAIVLDVDKTLEVRNNTIKLIKGTPVFTGETAQKPILIKEDLHNQYPLAYVTRSAGASATINQADIEYMVGTDECPMVIGLLEAINIEQVYAQLKDEFYLWWDGVILGDPDMATHLQDQIDELESRLQNIESEQISTDVAEKLCLHFQIDENTSTPGAYRPCGRQRTEFLPDGCIVTVAQAYEGLFPTDEVSTTSPTYNSKNVNLYLLIYDMLGVGSVTKINTKSLFGYPSGPNASAKRSSGTSNFCVVDIENESYPVKIYLMYAEPSTWVSYLPTEYAWRDNIALKSAEYKYTTVTITSDHVVSINTQNITLTPEPVALQDRNGKINLGHREGISASVTQENNHVIPHFPAFPAYLPNDNYLVVPVSSTYKYSSNSNNTWYYYPWVLSFYIDSNKIITTKANMLTPYDTGYLEGYSTEIGSSVPGNGYCPIYIPSLSKVCAYVGRNTANGAYSNSVLWFNANGSFDDYYPYEDLQYSLSEYNWFKTDYNVVTGGNKIFHIIENDKNALKGSPFSYSTMDLVTNEMPSVATPITPIIEGSSGGSGSGENPYKYPHTASNTVSASTAITGLVSDPDGIYLIGAVNKGFKILLLQGGTTGVWSSYCGDYPSFTGAEYNPTIYRFENAKSINSMLFVKKSFWHNTDRTKFMFMVTGNVTSLGVTSSYIASQLAHQTAVFYFEKPVKED